MVSKVVAMKPRLWSRFCADYRDRGVLVHRTGIAGIAPDTICRTIPYFLLEGSSRQGPVFFFCDPDRNFFDRFLSFLKNFGKFSKIKVRKSEI